MSTAEGYRRRFFLEEANRAYVKLREDQAAWEEELHERRIWDVALADDLEEELRPAPLPR